jgi:ABC-type transport system involved in multi-copper enzyme maturation permease subunit
MVLAIVRKELREIRAFAALAIGLYLIYVLKLMGQGSPLLKSLLMYVPGMGQEPSDVPFLQDSFISMYVFIGIALAIALGFRQSAWEPSQGTALYLLHLPLSRRAIFLTKLVTGIALLLACMLLPILIYATWAAAPRTHPGPFEWSMTGLAFQIWLVAPVVYLGAFASGIRPARWFGSRLLPLVAVAVPCIFACAVPFWWPVGFPVLVITAAVLLSDILRETETRDF